MVCFLNVESVDRIIYSIFHRFILEWKTLSLITIVGTTYPYRLFAKHFGHG